jgi:hypothetical protein
LVSIKHTFPKEYYPWKLNTVKNSRHSSRGEVFEHCQINGRINISKDSFTIFKEAISIGLRDLLMNPLIPRLIH